MKRIDTTRAANAYGGAAGGTGHFQETDPAGATQLDAMWFEGLQEEVAGLITGYGGTLTGDQTANLYATVDAVLGGARGIKSHATDTGVVTNTHTALVIGSDTSRANAQSAVVMASSGQTNAETYSVKGGTGGTARWALRAGEGAQAALLKVGGDVDAGTGETVRVAGATGDVHAEGDVRVGGDATAGTGATITLEGATGAVACNAPKLPYSSGSDGDNDDAITLNDWMVSLEFTCTAAGRGTIAAASEVAFTWNSTAIPASCTIMAILHDNTSGTGLPMVTRARSTGAGVATIIVGNMHAGAVVDGTLRIRAWIILEG